MRLILLNYSNCTKHCIDKTLEKKVLAFIETSGNELILMYDLNYYKQTITKQRQTWKLLNNINKLQQLQLC